MEKLTNNNYAHLRILNDGLHLDLCVEPSNAFGKIFPSLALGAVIKMGSIRDLKAKGLDARVLGQFGGLHFVAAASYNSLQEAKADLDRVRGNASGAWIFKYNDN